MVNRILPTPEKIRELLRYDPVTGMLYWVRRNLCDFSSDNAYGTWNARYSGKEAFTSTNQAGYKVGAIFNKKYYAHRVGWAIYYGEWPKSEIDHINGEKNDNRICNLRLATGSQNRMNSRMRSDNSSGLKGASYLERDRVWSSSIGVMGKIIRIGLFSSAEEAHEAYCKAAMTYHGEFARTE